MSHPVTIVADHTLIPADVLERAGLKAGDNAVAEATADGLLIRPATVSERVDADIAAGRASEFDSDAEFRAALVSRMQSPE